MMAAHESAFHSPKIGIKFDNHTLKVNLAVNIWSLEEGRH